MDIDGLSVQTILKFVNLGYINSFSDIYRLESHYDEISELEGFGEKSVANLRTSINKSRTVRAANFLYALCIPMIGADASKKIVEGIGLDGFLQRLKEGKEFDDIEGIGPERSTSVLKWYSGTDRAKLDELISELNITDAGAKDKSTGELYGLTFVITGDVNVFKNRSEFKEYTESKGGKVAGSVSKKTDYLVNNDAASESSKNRRARELNIPVITEAEFIERFGAP